MGIIGTLVAVAAILMCMVMAQGVWAEERPVKFATATEWVYPPDVADHPPMETVGKAATPLYMTCTDDCAAPPSVEISDGLPGYYDPAPSALTWPSEKPYYDDHVDGSHRVLVGFLIMEHCHCEEPGYAIQHRNMRLLVTDESDLVRISGIYIGFLGH